MSGRRGGTLVIVLGDQLDPHSPALAGLDPTRDTVLLVEAPAEAAQVWSHKARIVLFFAAMRHYAAAVCHQNHRHHDAGQHRPPVRGPG